MNLGLRNKIVIIVGGTYGIGSKLVVDFLNEGSIVHVLSRNNNPINDYKFKYKSNLFYYKCDANNEVELKNVLVEILTISTKIDILIHNVGDGSGERMAIQSKKEWDISWDINFQTALNTSRIFSDELLKSRGSILFISSIAGVEQIGAPTSYSVAKSALITYAKVLSHKLGPGVRVNIIAPGNILTKGGLWDEKLKNEPDLVNKMLIEKVPLKCFGLPEDVSNVALFISSNKANFITGSCFIVDGGQTTSF
jgi:3-oxoacyl-[acyl-carrier protein] reductase